MISIHFEQILFLTCSSTCIHGFCRGKAAGWDPRLSGGLERQHRSYGERRSASCGLPKAIVKTTLFLKRENEWIIDTCGGWWKKWLCNSEKIKHRFVREMSKKSKDWMTLWVWHHSHYFCKPMNEYFKSIYLRYELEIKPRKLIFQNCVGFSLRTDETSLKRQKCVLNKIQKVLFNGYLVKL